MRECRRHNRDRTKLSSAKRKLVAVPPVRKGDRARHRPGAPASGSQQQPPASRRVPTAPGAHRSQRFQAASWVRVMFRLVSVHKL
jgi:hypothetical protein